MQNFVVQSLIASVVLTVLLNLAPRLFPSATRRAEDKLAEAIQDRQSAEPGDRPSRVRVFFPWKVMLAISIGLTILVNMAGLLGR